MNKEDLLRNIADTGYNVGFGAKKHFATYDIVAKVPGNLGFVSIAIGIFALYIDLLSTKHLSAVFIILGIAGICINQFDKNKDCYADVGSKLTNLYNRLKSLYYAVKASKSDDLSDFKNELTYIECEYNQICISEQILFADWYAHYKFFWQHQISWIEEQKKFKFFRDKIPLSFMATIVLLILSIIFSVIV